ncbi:MAG: D-alanyl-D-alanine carboxypeptidase/D-alanyl-D-alanine-endopeptidase [Lentisphaeria bacterium]|nr:D-alanyl-D-alanine carboxypeptidase/D-alanyl-D-alanine-endopeptidase [Lentisphaeria bacterium]
MRIFKADTGRAVGRVGLSLMMMTCGCASLKDMSGCPRRDMTAAIDTVLQSDALRTAQTAVFVQRMDTGAVMYARSADTQLVPASNVKLITGAGALLTWGPDRRFRTALALAGGVSDGILNGDLVVCSEGDPSLRVEFTDNPLSCFEQWAADLNRRGVREARGDIVLLENPRGLAGYGAGWALDDLPWGYAAPVSRHQIHGNRVTVDMDPPEAGKETCSIRVFPPQAETWIDCQVTTAAEGPVTVSWRPGKAGLRVRGGLPPRSVPERLRLGAPEPVELYGMILKDTLATHGIAVTGRVVCQSAWHSQADLSFLTPWFSAPVSDLVTVMLRESDNVLAESLVRLADGEGRFLSDPGRHMIKEKLTAAGVDLTHVRYADGSGLSRYNHVSARQLVSVLRVMGNSRHGDVWRRSLPLAGEEGTLSHRFIHTPLAGNLRAKTGSMSSIRALSGYFTGRSGEEYAFCILVNGASAPGRDVTAAVDKMVSLFYHAL